MIVTVFRDKFAKSWPRHEEGGTGYALEAGRAFRRRYSADAHCVAYVSSTPRRLSMDAVGKTDITLRTMLVDVDCSAVHGSADPAPEEWRSAELVKVRALNAQHPGVFAYDSRGGYRIVLALPEPVEIHDREDIAAWRRFYKIALAYVGRRFGIVGDPSCSDWSRLFRMPHATRDANVGPEQRSTFGNPDNIGTFTFEPSDEDVRIAAATTKGAPRKKLNLSTSHIGDGLLFHLLDADRAIGDEAPRGGRICLCPNRSKHTVDTNWTDSTVWYPPAGGKEIGNIYCRHGHCEDFKVSDWLSFFGESEKDEARRRAGIVFEKKTRAA